MPTVRAFAFSRTTRPRKVRRPGCQVGGRDDTPAISLPGFNIASIMADTEWWQRGPVDGVPAMLQPVAHILLQVRESVDEMVPGLTEEEWNARPAGVASAAFHVRHIAGVIDRLFTYARGDALSETQFETLRAEGAASTPQAGRWRWKRWTLVSMRPSRSCEQSIRRHSATSAQSDGRVCPRP